METEKTRNLKLDDAVLELSEDPRDHITLT
jgi:hypothetical protein